jgi:serine/threonine-protein kinase
MDNTSQTPALQPESASPLCGQDLTGKAFGDYQVLRSLGQGGMGQVYLAEQVSLKRKVALKFLRPDLAANAASLQRFRHEAESVAKATHANIVQVYAIGELDGLHFMALEYIDGRNLKEHVARKGPPELLLALSIMRQTAAALQRAGELGIVHRDIKPENILLTRKGEVKVADFGLSRCLAPDQQPLNLTQSGVTMGTPLYMSPEQVEGKPLDPRSDIYSLGVTCYHMLSGQPPFRGQTAFEVALQHVQATPPPLEQVRPDLPPELCAIVRRMMAKTPDERYQTCRDLLKDLTRLREAIPGAPAGQSAFVLPSMEEVAASREKTAVFPPTRRRRWLPWLVAASLVLAALSGAALARARLKKPAEPPTAPATDDTRAVEALFSQQKREQFLKDAVDQYANPSNDLTSRLGAGHIIELGLLYLDQWRLDEADEFFSRLMKSTVKPYANLGRLGHAVVLGLQNYPAESNQAFKELLKDVRAPRQALYLLENPQLAQWVARSLDYNATNAPTDFPKELQFLRYPGGGLSKAAGKRTGTDKASPGP